MGMMAPTRDLARKNSLVAQLLFLTTMSHVLLWNHSFWISIDQSDHIWFHFVARSPSCPIIQVVHLKSPKDQLSRQGSLSVFRDIDMVGCPESPAEELHMVTCFSNGLMFNWHEQEREGESQWIWVKDDLLKDAHEQQLLSEPKCGQVVDFRVN